MSEPASSTIEPIAAVAFGSYSLVAKLAVGGMGELFLARRPAFQGLSQLVVLKRIRLELASDPQFVSRFLAEARVLLHLQHSAITPVFDVGSVEGRSYIALEFVDGKDLRSLLSRTQQMKARVPPALALQIMLRVLDALAYAHRKKGDDGQELGLVHRDVSPQNVLVSYDGEVKVIDFGLAKSALSGQRTQPSMILGKLLYMAPEIATHDSLDRRADLFSTAVVLHELLLGQHALAKVSNAELMSRVVNPRFSLLEGVVPGIPPGLDAALQKALDVRPEQRYRSAEEMRGALLPLAVAAGSDLSPEPLGERMRATFSDAYAAERKLLRALRGAGPERSAGETLRSVDLGTAQAMAPTSLFPVIGAAAPSGPAAVDAASARTYVGAAPASSDGSRGATEPAMARIDSGEFVFRPTGRTATAGEMEIPGSRPALRLPKAGKLVALHAQETMTGTPAVLPAQPRAVAQKKTDPVASPSASVATAPALASLPSEPLTAPPQALETPPSRIESSPPRTRSTGGSLPAANPPQPVKSSVRLEPLLLGVGLGAVLVALLVLALVLLRR